MRGSRQFCKRGSIIDSVSFVVVFLVAEGEADPNTTKSGPLSARKRNTIQMTFRWRADDDPTLNASLSPPPLWIRA